MSILERYFAPARGAIREFVGINAFFEPADLGLYRRLLASPFDVPEQPLVKLATIDYLKAAPWPLTPWQEWAVMLSCLWRGTPGWFPVTAPVTKWLPMSAGRYLGYPKYVADSITLTRTGERWVARAEHRGVRQLRVQFEPDASHPRHGWAADLLGDEAFFKGNVYVVAPPGSRTGPRRISFSYVEQSWTSQPGIVHLEVDPNEAWAGLVPGIGPFAGQSSHFVGGLNLVAN